MIRWCNRSSFSIRSWKSLLSLPVVVSKKSLPLNRVEFAVAVVGGGDGLVPNIVMGIDVGVAVSKGGGSADDDGGAWRVVVDRLLIFATLDPITMAAGL